MRRSQPRLHGKQDVPVYDESRSAERFVDPHGRYKWEHVRPTDLAGPGRTIASV